MTKQSLSDLELELLFNMKKIFIVILIFFFNHNFNQVNAQVVYIDINFILNESEIGKSLNNYIKTLNDKNIQKFNKIETELISKEKSILAKKNILEKEAFDKNVDELSKEIQKYRLDKKSSNDDLNKSKIEYTKEILGYLNPIITDYVDKNGISLVIPKKNIIIGKKKLDITYEIIDILNNQKNSLNF